MATGNNKNSANRIIYSVIIYIILLLMLLFAYIFGHSQVIPSA